MELRPRPGDTPMGSQADWQKRIGYRRRMAKRPVKAQAKGQKEGERDMKKRGKMIEVRFFETAEFHVTPTETAIDRDDCPGASE